MDQNKFSSAIRFSRTLTFWDALAIGISTILPLTAFIAMRVLVPHTKGESGLICLLGGLLYLPIVLSLCELSSTLPRGTSLYQLPGAAKRHWYVFSVDWLFLGGYLLVAALLTLGLAERAGVLVQLFFGAEPSTLVLTTAILALVLVYSTFAAAARLDFSKAIVLSASFIVLSTVIWFFFTHSAGRASLPKDHSLEHWLTAIAVLGIALWGIPLVMENQHLFRGGNKTTSLGSLVSWVFSFVTAFAAVMVVISFPELYAFESMPETGWEDSRMHLFAVVVIAVLLWVALRQIVSTVVRISLSMSAYGFLPKSLGFGLFSKSKDSAGLSPELVLRTLLSVIVVGALTLLVHEDWLLYAAAAQILLVSVVLLVPLAGTSQSNLPVQRWLRLPLHPVFPLVSVVFAGFLSLLLLREFPYLPASWILAGALWYLLYGREASLDVRQEETLIGETEQDEKEDKFCVAILAYNDEQFDSLYRLANALAKKQEGEVLVLDIVIASEHLPISHVRSRARGELQGLEKLIAAHTDVRPVVRIASSLTDGVLETVRELDIDVLILPGDIRRRSLQPTEELDLDRIFHHTSKPVLAVFGRLPREVKSITLAAGSSEHAKAALGYADTLAQNSMKSPKVALLRVNTRRADQQRDQAALAGLLEGFAPLSEMEKRMVQGVELEKALLGETRSTDLMLIGAAVDPVLERTSLSGLPKDVAQARRRSTVVVKGAESVQHFWMRRLTETISEILPQVSRNEQAEVYSQMRGSSRAGIDFYMLMLLASAIATLGLLLNSAGVIIGAMLIAPLMSPILSIASGVVHGNLMMIQRGMRSVLFGILLALVVSIVITVITPTRIPESEILGRTQPNVLDLLVALAAGAAAAYGVSRRSVAAALPGVAISVALVPPLCVVGFGLGSSDFEIAGGAMLLFLTNFAGIVAIGSVMFYLLGFRPTEESRKNRFHQTVVMALFVLVIIMIPLGFATQDFAQINSLKIRLEEMVRDHMRDRMKINRLKVSTDGKKFLVDAALDAYVDVFRNDLERAQKALSEEIGAPVHIRVSVTRAQLFDVKPAEEKAGQGLIRSVEDAVSNKGKSSSE